MRTANSPSKSKLISRPSSSKLTPNLTTVKFKIDTNEPGYTLSSKDAHILISALFSKIE